VAKEVTREQAERKDQQAAEFMERLGESDRANEFDAIWNDLVRAHQPHQGRALEALGEDHRRIRELIPALLQKENR
jgi:hypothetical protein